MFRLFMFLLGLLGASALWAEDAYRIHRGDTLRVEVLEDDTLQRNVLVMPDGCIALPLVGSVKVAGKTPEEAEALIRSAVASKYTVPPTVFVGLVQLARSEGQAAPRGPAAEPAKVQIFLVGEFESAGAKQVAPGTTLLQALATGSGFTRFAATKRIQLRRRDAASGAEQVQIVNFAALSQGGALGSDPQLLDGDVILAPERRLFE